MGTIKNKLSINSRFFFCKHITISTTTRPFTTMSSLSTSSAVADDSHNSSYNQINSVLKSLPPSVREFLVGDNKDNITSTLYGYNVSRPEGSKLDLLRQYSRDDDGSPEKMIGICNIVTLAPFMVNGHRNDRMYYDVVGKCFWFI